MIPQELMPNVRSLAAAVIVEAIRDYCEVKNEYEKVTELRASGIVTNPRTEDRLRIELKGLIEFFDSDWFDMLMIGTEMPFTRENIFEWLERVRVSGKYKYKFTNFGKEAS